MRTEEGRRQDGGTEHTGRQGWCALTALREPAGFSGQSQESPSSGPASKRPRVSRGLRQARPHPGLIKKSSVSCQEHVPISSKSINSLITL